MGDTSDIALSLSPAAVLPLGDNQYDEGTLDEFEHSYDPTWGRLNSIAHPVPGNHEYRTPGASGYFDYFGGLAGARDQGYYSYDIGNWHLVALNSNCEQIGGCYAGSPQDQWLVSDLEGHPTNCSLAYWHEPRFSSGMAASNSEFITMWHRLYEAGADVILNGHDHFYERFAPQNPDGVSDSASGIIEFVVGTGGNDFNEFKTSASNSEYRQNTSFGLIELALHTDSFEWEFVSDEGQTLDQGSRACH